LRPILAALALSGLLLTAAAGHAANVGDPAPGFTLLDTQDVPRSLSDYDGQVVVLFLVGYG